MSTLDTTVMLKTSSATCAGDDESVTWTVKVLTCLVVAVPVMAPVEAARLSPAGSEPPGIDHVYGPVPPDAARVAEYATVNWALGSDVVVTETAVTGIAMEKLAVALLAGDAESTTLIVKEVVPAAVGVPEMIPVEDANVRPPGNEPEDTDQVYGVVPPVAANVCE